MSDPREVVEMLHPAAARRIGKPVQLVRLVYTVNPTADAVYSVETGELLGGNVQNGGDESATIRVSLERLANPDRAQAEVENAAYQLGCLLFETGGEYNRRPDGSRVMDGNGHHMAQEIAAMVGAYWAGRVTPRSAT